MSQTGNVGANVNKPVLQPVTPQQVVQATSLGNTGVQIEVADKKNIDNQVRQQVLTRNTVEINTRANFTSNASTLSAAAATVASSGGVPTRTGSGRVGTRDDERRPARAGEAPRSGGARSAMSTLEAQPESILSGDIFAMGQITESYKRVNAIRGGQTGQHTQTEDDSFEFTIADPYHGFNIFEFQQMRRGPIPDLMRQFEAPKFKLPGDENMSTVDAYDLVQKWYDKRTLGMA